MKRIFTLLKTTFILLFLGIGFEASAQKISPSDQTKLMVGPGTATVPAFDKTKAIFCAASNSFKLNASTTDANGNTFSQWEWFEISSTGGGTVAQARSTNKTLTLSNVTAGYHTYQVYGYEDLGNTISCPSDAPETFTVYVLPALTVSAAVATGGSNLKYCVNTVPGEGSNPGTPIQFSATPAFNGTVNSVSGITDLNISDFELEYKWYKVAEGQTRAAGSTPVYTSTAQNTYTITSVNGSDIGRFKYEVDVTYTVKNTCAAGLATVTTSASPTIVEVVAAPNKPTITIQ